MRPSTLLGIKYRAVAFDFDLAATTRLLIYDDEKEDERQIKLLARIFGDGGLTSAAQNSVTYANTQEW